MENAIKSLRTDIKELKECVDNEKKQEKKVFEAGDRVVLTLSRSSTTLPCVKEAVKDEIVFTVNTRYPDGMYSLLKDGFLFRNPQNDYIVVFKSHDLEHAPEEQEKEKVLKWGSFAEIREDYDCFKKGDVVLVCLTDEDCERSLFYVSRNKTNGKAWIPKRVLKAL